MFTAKCECGWAYLRSQGEGEEYAELSWNDRIMQAGLRKWWRKLGPKGRTNVKRLEKLLASECLWHKGPIWTYKNLLQRSTLFAEDVPLVTSAVRKMLDRRNYCDKDCPCLAEPLAEMRQ
ncbi:MAG: hypothetical protein AAB562_00005 [Patescibacteria group bacterium]